MDITGRLIQLLPDVEGDSPRGHWVRGGFVIETDGEYPRKVAFTAFGEERVAMAKNIPMGSPVQVTFNPESREFNEKWYTDLRASRIQPFAPGQMPTTAAGYAWTGAAPAPAAAPASTPAAPTPATTQDQPANFATPPVMESNPDDDLPF